MSYYKLFTDESRVSVMAEHAERDPSADRHDIFNDENFFKDQRPNY